MPTGIIHLWYDFCYWLSMAGMTLAFSLRTEGEEHVPAEGPTLLIGNHQSVLDPILVGLAARRRLHFLARKSLFRFWGLNALMRSLNGVPVDIEGFAREGLTTILEQLQAGRGVVVFPEGNRTPDGKMQPFRPGIHLMIKRIPMAVVPVGIAGAFDAWPRHQPLPTPAPLICPGGTGSLAVSIGPPIDSRRLADLPRGQVLDELYSAVEKCQLRAEQLRRKL
jgi:1-acyl-sn-glycerol-3-phosphate acyltransferase